jgi:hypothetical protein
MTKVYFRKTGSAESGRYIEYSLEDVKKIIGEAFEENRIVVNMVTNERIFDVTKVGETDVLRCFPIVWGG